MGKHKKTVLLIEEMKTVLQEQHPQTVRQVYYALVSKQIIANSKAQYVRVSSALVDARQDGVIPWEWVEDRIRLPHNVDMWQDLQDFGDTVIQAYKKDVWKSQPGYTEVWLEKDALSGIFIETLEPYRITLNVGRGYDGWSSIKNAVDRFTTLGDKKWNWILYYGDFDPSGEDMFSSLQKRLKSLGLEPMMLKCALTPDDIKTHNLPPAITKVSDTRSKGFIEKNGAVSSVELDALPLSVLKQNIISNVERVIDLEALKLVKQVEETERLRLSELLKGI